MTTEELSDIIEAALSEYKPPLSVGSQIHSVQQFGSAILVKTYSAADNADYIIRIERA